MGLSIALSNAMSGLQTARAALDAVANNVANVNTEGYTRKVVKTGSIVLGGEGRGVRIESIERQVSETLVRDVRNEHTVLGAAEVEREFFSRMQDMFGTLSSNSSLSSGLAKLTAALTTAAATPENATLRSNAIATADQLARQLNDMATTIQNLRLEAERQIAASLDTVNQQLAQVAELNRQISHSSMMGQPVGELQDKRDIALNTIAGEMDVAIFERETGVISVLTTSGRPMAATEVSEFSHATSAMLDGSITYSGGGIAGIMLGGVDVTSHLTSGRLGELIAMRDETLPSLAAQIDQLASVLKTEINEIHNAGTGFPPPHSLTGTRTITGGGAAAFAGTGSVRIAVTNADGTFAAAPLDLNLFAHATVGALVAAINAGLGGAGTASLDATNRLVITATNADDGIAIHENTSAIGGEGFSSHFGLNDFFTATSGAPAKTLAVRADLLTTSSNLSTGELSLATGVVAGETVAVGASDNRAAARLLDAFDQPFGFLATGDLGASTTTFEDYATQILSRNAAKTAAAEERQAFHQTLITDLQAKASAVSGVNMDEELSNLVIYQAAYNASARLIQVVADMLRTLEEMAK